MTSLFATWFALARDIRSIVYLSIITVVLCTARHSLVEITQTKRINEKSAQRRRKHCALAVAMRTHKQTERERERERETDRQTDRGNYNTLCRSFTSAQCRNSNWHERTIVFIARQSVAWLKRMRLSAPILVLVFHCDPRLVALLLSQQWLGLLIARNVLAVCSRKICCRRQRHVAGGVNLLVVAS